jgi:hypothetical protein
MRKKRGVPDRSNATTRMATVSGGGGGDAFGSGSAYAFGSGSAYASASTTDPGGRPTNVAKVSSTSNAKLVSTLIKTGGSVYGLVFEGKGIVLRSMDEVRRWVENANSSLHLHPYKRFKSLDAARKWLLSQSVPILLGWRIDTEREQVDDGDTERSEGVSWKAAGEQGREQGRDQQEKKKKPGVDELGDLLAMLGESVRPGARDYDGSMRRVSRTPLERAMRRTLPAGPSSASPPAPSPFLVTAGPRAAVAIMDEATGQAGVIDPSANEFSNADRGDAGEQALNYSEMEVVVNDFPTFEFSLRLRSGQLYAHTRNLSVRKEWENVSGLRAQLAAAFLEALNTDLGSVANALRLTNLDLLTTLRKHMARWRQNSGKDAKGKPVPHFDLLDALLATIESRGLMLRFRDTTGILAKQRIRAEQQAKEAAAGGGGSGDV